MSTKIIDKTKGKRPKRGYEFDVIITTNTGGRYSYHGKTKKACRGKYKISMSQVAKEEWSISEI